MKTIWIINEYAGSPYHGMEFRHYYFAKELIKNGFDVTIISASYSHLFKNSPIVKKSYQFENIDGINYLWIKVNKYKNARTIGRIIKWFIFTIKLFFIPVKNEPSYIITSPMQTMEVIPAYYLSKKFKSKFIFEIRDIWPLTLIELKNYSSNNPFIKLLSWAENFAIRKSDLIISVLPGYGKYLQDNGINKDFLYLPNCVSIDDLKKEYDLDEKIKNKIPDNKFIIGYTGTIGLANAIDILIDVAIMLEKYKDIFFVIVGDGADKERLKNKASNYKNIIFIDSIPKFQIQSILKKFNLCYIGTLNKNFYKYGVSMNKIFDYMYSEKPILEAINTEYSLVKMANCGIQTEAEKVEKIAEAILKFYNMTEDERKELGLNGKRYLLENHTYDKIVKKFIENLV